MARYPTPQRCLLGLLLLLSFSAVLNALEIGSSHRDVLEELGKPDGELSAGSRQILTYGEAKVTLNDGKVVSFSPQLTELMQERAQQKAEIEAKRESGLVNHKGTWVKASELEKERAEAAAAVSSGGSSAGSGSSGKSSSGWLTDYDAAMKLAREQNKQVLLNFTGSDWCGWCIKLDKEVFSQKEFLDYAAKNYVLVKLDFPRRTQLSSKLQRQNESLAQQFKISGFPSIVVLNKNGGLHKRGGYVPGGPKAFIKSIR